MNQNANDNLVPAATDKSLQQKYIGMGRQRQTDKDTDRQIDRQTDRQSSLLLTNFKN